MAVRNSGALTPYIARRLASRRLDSSLPLLRLIAAGGARSQREAARALGVTQGACNLHFQRLEHDGLLHRIDHRRGRQGRPTIVWDVDRRHNAHLIYVCDVPDLRVSLVDLGGDVLDESRIALEAGDCRAAAAAVADCAARARRVAQERGIRLWQAVGAFPGLIDPRGETVCQAVNLPALDGLPFRRLLAAQGLAARAVSLGLCFFLGETAARPPGDAALVVHWDLGVGAVGGNGDTILGTRLGADGAAEIVELGHVCIAPGGRRCRCGGRGCLEAYAGGNAILARLRSGAIRGLPHLLDALAAGQPAALAAMRNAARLLGRNLSWPLQLSGAGQLILTGPLSAAFARFSPALQAGLAEGLPPERLRALKVVASSDPTRNLRTGAFRLAMLLLLDPEAATRLPRSPMRLIHSAAP